MADIDRLIGSEHQGIDREMLVCFYTAALSEGGTVDEINLRAIRAVLARWGAAGSPAGAAATAAVAAAIAAGQPVTLPSGAVIADPAWLESRIAIRDVLAQPEPAPTTDGEVAELVAWLRREACFDSQWAASAWAPRLNRAADLLERQAAAAPVARLPEDAQVIEPANRTILVPVPAPIPVSERLPGPKDCDAEGRCWWGDAGDDQFVPSWRLCEQPDDTHFTHWLPAHALPLPEVNND